ncbi:MAG: alginate export family protein [Leeuwenhoekiella sp.]
MYLKNLFLAFFVLSASATIAQEFSLGADLRQRFEYRHGFNNLFPDDADPTAFIRQRARLNFEYSAEKLKVFIAVQDISTWGDTRQILPQDGNDSFMLFQAWASLRIDENWSTKLGRQVLSYDDQRIFGGLDWAMQGRFHDAALLKYVKNGLKADLGFAYSNQGEPQLNSLYSVNGFFSYKTMQFVHINKKWNKSSVSLLLLNNGFQKSETTDGVTVPDGLYNRQTAGTYFKFPLGKVNLAGSAYYQFGDANAAEQSLSACQASIEATYKPGSCLYGLGFEALSGTDQGSTGDNNSFFPLYGTNHKFNGFMDYFYVGNHANNVGLNDLYAKTVIKTGTTSTLLLKAHYFSANAALANDADSYLGTEVDVVFTQPLFKNVKLNLGYSQMFASDSMSLIKGGRASDNTNNWGWAMLVINPNLFSKKLEQ